MADVRLIDANALYDTITDVASSVGHDVMAVEDVHHCIDKAPTIDAVPVVRCRECKYKNIPKCCPFQITGFKVENDWYCPIGRKDGCEGGLTVARNLYAGTCYSCGAYVPPGYGHFERTKGPNAKWRVKCVKCASGRTVTADDPCVKAVERRLAKMDAKDMDVPTKDGGAEDAGR